MEKYFASLKLSDDSPEHKLTRAISLSELPVSRRILIEERFQSDKTPNLLRQYSCEQIYDKGTNSSQIRVSQVIHSGQNNYQETWKAIVPHHQTIHPRKPIEDKVEHMEVDDDDFLSRATSKSSKNSPTGPVISETETKSKPPKEQVTSVDKTKQPDKEQMKKVLHGTTNKDFYLLTEKPTTKDERRMTVCCFWLFSIVIPGFILMFSVLAPRNSDLEMEDTCNHASYFQNGTISLQENIYGQNQAVNSLTKYLNRNTPCLKVIALVGSTGVGKSYTAEILKKHYPMKDKILQYYPPINKPMSRNKFSYIFCNFVILENLGKNDIDDAIKFVKTINDMSPYCVTILAIFNLQTVRDDLARDIDIVKSVTTIKDSFYNEYIDIEVVSYEPLDEEALEKCIMKVAENTNVKMTREQMISIRDNLMSSNTGCKGAHSKVQLIQNDDT